LDAAAVAMLQFDLACGSLFNTAQSRS